MGRKTARVSRFGRFFLLLFMGVFLGAIFMLLFPQYLVKKPPEGAFLKSAFNGEGLPLSFSIVLWNGLRPPGFYGKQTFPFFPESLLQFAETTLPDLLVFACVPLVEEPTAKGLPERPILPNELDRRFSRYGLYAVKTESDQDTHTTLQTFHLLWSRTKPDVIPKDTASLGLGIFAKKEPPLSLSTLEYTREQRKLLVYLPDFSAVRDRSEWEDCLRVLKEEIVAQYAQGKSVLVAGDWRGCLPGAQNCLATMEQIPILWTPEGWSWFYPCYPDLSPFASSPFRDAFSGILASPDLLAREFETFTPQASTSENEPMVFNSAIRVVF